MDIDQICERMRQNRRMLRAQLTPSAPPALSPEARIGLALEPGTRVFDTISGLEGEVVSGARENVIVHTPRRSAG